MVLESSISSHLKSIMANQTLHVPPFPLLTWEKYFWIAEIRLASWAGFQTRGGTYGAESSADPSDGTVRLHVMTGNREAQTPSPEQARAFQQLLKEESAIAATVLLAIFEDYPKQRGLYGYDNDLAAEIMPDIERPNQLRDLIGLSNVHILHEATQGVSYLGFEFGCTWDDEHGLGVITHQGLVLQVGGADQSFSTPD